MRKIRSDASCNLLTARQCETLDGWLFDENLSYPEVAKRVQTEFKVALSVSGLSRYYRQLAPKRREVELVEAQLTAIKVQNLPVDMPSLRQATMKLVTKMALTQAIEKPHEWQQLAALTRLLIDYEDMETRRERVEVARRSFDYKAAKEATEELPSLRAYMETIRDDDKLSPDEKLEQVHDLLWPWSEATAKAEAEAKAEEEEDDDESETPESEEPAEEEEKDEEITTPEESPAPPAAESPEPKGEETGPLNPDNAA